MSKLQGVGSPGPGSSSAVSHGSVFVFLRFLSAGLTPCQRTCALLSASTSYGVEKAGKSLRHASTDGLVPTVKSAAPPHKWHTSMVAPGALF